MLIAWPIDALDGTMARLRGEATDWGAFVDSVSYRYSELIVLGGLLYYFATVDEHILSVVTFAAAAGSVLVSYVKAVLRPGFSAGKVSDSGGRYLVLGPALRSFSPIGSGSSRVVPQHSSALCGSLASHRAKAREEQMRVKRIRSGSCVPDTRSSSWVPRRQFLATRVKRRGLI
jgi:hypothetical protein